MKWSALFLALVLSTSSLFSHPRPKKDVENPYTVCLIDGVLTNCSMLDYSMGGPISGELLNLVFAIRKQTLIKDNIVILADRTKKLPDLVAVSPSGEGCPHGIVSYCHNVVWMKRVDGLWSIDED